MVNKFKYLMFALFLVSSSLYLGICFGYFLSKIFYNFSRTNFRKLRKTISFKKIIKIFVNFLWKRIKNWLMNILQKVFLLMDGTDGVIEGLIVFGKKWNKRLKFKKRFQLLKRLVVNFYQLIMLHWALMDAFSFGHNLIKSIIYQINTIIQLSFVIQLLMTESIFLTIFLYGLFWIILAIFGVLLGFLFGVYTYGGSDQEYQFILFLLLRILYNNARFYEESYDEFYDALRIRSFKFSAVEKFENFSLKIIPQIDLRPLKIMFMQTDPTIQIPSPVFTDSLENITIDLISEEATNYKFELFKFYRKKRKKII